MRILSDEAWIRLMVEWVEFREQLKELKRPRNLALMIFVFLFLIMTYDLWLESAETFLDSDTDETVKMAVLGLGSVGMVIGTLIVIQMIYHNLKHH